MIQTEICPYCDQPIRVSCGQRDCPSCGQPIRVSPDWLAHDLLRILLQAMLAPRRP